MLTYPVNEMFASIQGEGYWAGTPAIFIRLQGCNVGCPWCDTKNSWPSAESTDITERIDRMCSTYAHVRHAVITGGEPCQFDLVPLMKYLSRKIGFLQIETSGYFPPPKFNGSYWLTVSPKSFNRNFDDKCIKMATEIKVVVGSYTDIEFAEFCRTQNRTEHFYIQPMSEQKNAVDICLTYALEKNWKVSARVHKQLGIK